MPSHKLNYIDCKALNKMLEAHNPNLVLVDVREDYEYDIVHIDGCKHIPLDKVLGKSDELCKADKLIFYCNSGKKSAAIAHTFAQKYDHPEIYSLIGGIQAYLQEN